MPLGNGISGINGDVVVLGVSLYEATKFSLMLKSNNQAYASNRTNGYKKRVAGVKDGSGNIDGVWDPGNPIYGTNIAGQLREGSTPQLYLYPNDNQYWNVYAIIDQFKIDVDFDEGSIVSWTFDFSTNGQWEQDTVIDESSNSSSSSSSVSTSASSSSS